MAVRFLVLRGNMVAPFGEVEIRGEGKTPGAIMFDPVWGLNRGDECLVAVQGSKESPSWDVGIAENGLPVIRASSKEPERGRELVLVQEYRTGTGAKRWPAFYVEYGPRVQILSEARSAGGSGWERWCLVLAPAGWAESIALQFYDERDAPDQTIRSPLS